MREIVLFAHGGPEALEVIDLPEVHAGWCPSPLKTGPLFGYRKGNADGSRTASGRGHTEFSA